MKVCMIVTNGFEEMEAVGTFALLRRSGLTVDVFALPGNEATGRFGLTCARLLPFNQLNSQEYEALVQRIGRKQPSASTYQNFCGNG